MPRKKPTTKNPYSDEVELPLQVYIDLPNTRAVSQILGLIGGGNSLSTLPPNIPDAEMSVGIIANSIHAAIVNAQNSAQPIPNDILAMMKLSDYFYKLEGDVAMTIDIPWEITGGEIQITADDTGAEAEWNALWRQHSSETGQPIIDIDELNASCYDDVEISGQWYPLEVWDGASLDGIAIIEPQSVWVGRPIAQNDINSPSDLPSEKLASLQHKIAYGYRGVDLNIQALTGTGIAIDSADLLPVHAKKRPYMRYAIPHMTRASRNIMHREVLEEYRRGTMEAFLSQIWLFTIGNDKQPATPSMLNAFSKKVSNAVKNRFGAIIANHTADGKVLSPNTLDQLLGSEAFTDLTQSIMRDLGFNLWLVSGEQPGGRSASSTVETALQYSIARWKHRNQQFIKWCEYISRKYAILQNSEALQKHLPKFTPAAISIEQAQVIRDRIMPFYMAGLLDPQQALKDGGYDYNKVVQNKKAHKSNEDMFDPPATYNQTFTGEGGEKTTAKTAPQGQGGMKKEKVVEASMEILGQGDEFRKEIDANLNNSDFFNWLGVALVNAMTKAFEDGWFQFGGLSEQPDYALLESAPQGIAYQHARLQEFRAVTGEGAPLRSRALMYAGAVHGAYILGVQQAMQTHGATHWQRVLRPELSLSGPCAECQADSNVIHSMDEPFFEYHPNGVCSAQAVQYHFGGGRNFEIRVPDFVNKLVR